MNFSQFCAAMEEWKPFPHDKVARQIKKKKERNASTQDMRQAGHMQGVARVMKTTDARKTANKHTGKSFEKTYEKEKEAMKKRDKEIKKYDKSAKKYAKADKRMDKMIAKAEKDDAGEGKKVSQKKRDKENARYNKATQKHQKNYDRLAKRTYQSAARGAERQAALKNNIPYQKYTDEDGGRRNDYRKGMKGTKTDLERQAEHNRKVNADRKTAKNMLNKAKLEKAYKKKSAPNSRTESLNFSQWLDAMVPPLYEANGVPQCPPGYRFDKKNLMCVPKTSKDDVSNEKQGDKKDMSPENMPSFNTIGSHGQNGAPHAYEEARYGPNPWGYQPGRPWTKVDDYYTGAKDRYYDGQPEASPFFESK